MHNTHLSVHTFTWPHPHMHTHFPFLPEMVFSLVLNDLMCSEKRALAGPLLFASEYIADLDVCSQR